MELRILDDDIQDFIDKNLNTDINKILLSKNKFQDVDIKLIVEQIESKKKSKDKLNTWFNKKGIYFPKKLSIEQTSSELTAHFKSQLFRGKNAIDLTGGFGIDAYYFSNEFENFTHCEYNEELSEIVKHNFSVLSKNNVKFISGDSLHYLKNSSDQFDLIYLDPARRSDVKGKVFMFKDTQPNPVENIDLLLSLSDNILIKASPILDIKKSVSELKNLKRIYIVSLNNEVKELLFHIEKNNENKADIQCVDLYSNKETIINTYPLEDEDLELEYSVPKKYLYEPSSAMLKSGLFKSISNRYSINKIAQHSHLYTSDNLIENFQGRTFIIEGVSKVGKKEISSNLDSLKANISTRNFKMDVKAIRKKFKIKDGGDNYLFFTTLNDGKSLIIYAIKS